MLCGWRPTLYQASSPAFNPFPELMLYDHDSDEHWTRSTLNQNARFNGSTLHQSLSRGYDPKKRIDYIFLPNDACSLIEQHVLSNIYPLKSYFSLELKEVVTSVRAVVFSFMLRKGGVQRAICSAFAKHDNFVNKFLPSNDNIIQQSGMYNLSRMYHHSQITGLKYNKKRFKRVIQISQNISMFCKDFHGELLWATAGTHLQLQCPNYFNEHDSMLTYCILKISTEFCTHTIQIPGAHKLFVEKVRRNNDVPYHCVPISKYLEKLCITPAMGIPSVSVINIVRSMDTPWIYRIWEPDNNASRSDTDIASGDKKKYIYIYIYLYIKYFWKLFPVTP